MPKIGEVPSGGVYALSARFGQEERGEIKLLPIPWTEISRGLGGGLYPGEVTVLAAPPGNGKSFVSAHLSLAAGAAGFRWRYLPLEDRQEVWLQRFGAVALDEWSFLDREKCSAAARQRTLKANQAVFRAIETNICENPRLPVADGSGRMVVPALPAYEILDWVHEAARDYDLLVIDPVSQIDFGRVGGKKWEDEEDFVRRLLGIAADSRCHVLLILHVVKRGGRNQMPLSLDDMQGSAAFSRFAHNVLLLETHDERESEVVCHVPNKIVTHKRTMIIGKGRTGSGGGSRFAVDFDHRGPALLEHGLIKPKRG